MKEPHKEPDQEDIKLEIEELPRINYRRRVPRFLSELAAGSRQRARFWQAGTAVIFLCLLLALFPGTFPLLQKDLSVIFTRPTPISNVREAQPLVSESFQSEYDTKNISIWLANMPGNTKAFARLDAAPQNCSQYSQTQNFDVPSFPAGVGNSPLWITGFSGPRATLDHLVRAQAPQLGWYQQLQLVGATNANSAIMLQGGVVGNLYPLWFGVYPHHGPVITTIQVKPTDSSLSNHTTDDQQWNVQPIKLYLAFAGCYYLQATWSGGSWTVYFAAGK